MQPSDVFLMYWAIGATALAVYFYYKLSKSNTAINVMMMAIKDIASGDAEVSIRGDRLTIRKTGDKDGDSTSK